MMLSNEVKTLCDFYLHGQNFVYIPIFLLLVLHVFKRNNWHVSWFKTKTNNSVFLVFIVVQAYSNFPVLYL